MASKLILDCGSPDDFGHYFLRTLQSEVRELNAAAAQLRREGIKHPSRDQILKDREGASYHRKFLTFRRGDAEPFGIDEAKFFEAYGRTDAGKYAKREAEAGRGTFGHFVDPDKIER